MNRSAPRFLHSLGTADQSLVMPFVQPWTAEAEDILFDQGSQLHRLWMLDEGIVRFEIMGSEGRRVVSAFGIPGRCIGDIELLGRCPGQATAVASTPCRGWTMSATALTEALDRVPSFARLMLAALARSSRLALLLYHHVLTLSPPERLALTLLNLARINMRVEDDNPLIVTVTQDMLSEMVGCSRQFVSKHLSQWTSKGWLAPRYGRIDVLNPDGLKSVINATINAEMFSLIDDI